MLFEAKAAVGSLVTALSFLPLSNLFCPGFVNMSMDYLLPESLSCNLTESHRGKSASHNTNFFFFSVHGRVAIGINLSLLSSLPHFCGHSALTITAFNSTCRPGNTTSALLWPISPLKADFHVTSPFLLATIDLPV